MKTRKIETPVPGRAGQPVSVSRRKMGCICRKHTLLALGAALVLAGCTGLQSPQLSEPSIFLLEAQPLAMPQAPKGELTLAVSVPRAGPGFDTARMIYVRQPHKIEYFARNRWADPPARMLAPLMVRALEEASGFRAVVPARSSLRADLRLDSELVRLRQDFSTRPSSVQLTLRANLIDVRAGQVLAAREFNETEPTATDDPAGGVSAANRAVQRMLGKLADFCAQYSGGR